MSQENDFREGVIYLSVICSEAAYLMEEVTMHRANEVIIKAIVIFVFLVGFAIPVSAQTVTAYEGARLMVGDGRMMGDATLVVRGTRIARVGSAADVRFPAGATRLSL